MIFQRKQQRISLKQCGFRIQIVFCRLTVLIRTNIKKYADMSVSFMYRMNCETNVFSSALTVQLIRRKSGVTENRLEAIIADIPRFVLN